MLDDSSRIITTSDSSDVNSDDTPERNSGKIVRRTLKTKEDIQNYVKHLI